MSVETTLAQHLERPSGRGHTPAGAVTGAAGGAACGDLVRVSLSVDPADPEGRIADIGFDAYGCGTAIAAGSAVVELVCRVPLLQAARVSAEDIAEELGGLSSAKLHAAELAADALHRALGMAARTQTQLAAVAERSVVAMSGGVDSAVAALMTARSGADVVAVTLELWSDPENDGERSCCSAQAVRGAREAAHRLGLPHLSIDLREEFRAGVVEHWLMGHAAGETPNPCVRCNGNVRLEAMLELARRLGGETLITGHYARLDWGDGPLLRVAADPVKDQSYVLCGLAPESLARMRFPLGDMHKAQVRELAEREGLALARKPDSQDLCFLAGTRLPRFLERHGDLRGSPGPIVDREGRELGAHNGSRSYTIGQRHGLGLGGGEPLYVLATDATTNTVTVGSRDALLTRTVAVREVTLRRSGAVVDHVKVRSRGRRVPCRLARPAEPGSHASIEVELEEPIERTAPGQMACLFAGDLIVGYGTIASLEVTPPARAQTGHAAAAH
ncbi:MAG TPA: tRNA 2-thiouridine(34) synthase MnmA [Solirubrobacteraceae bacterium]|nr:tRNA 2-thiouridine(34) synthase MnmA [Solirubrobacteraceae bacterium]